MTVVCEFTDEQWDALADYLTARGIEPGYDTELGRAMTSLIGQQSLSVDALRQIAGVLSDADARSTSGNDALGIAQFALSVLGADV